MAKFIERPGLAGVLLEAAEVQAAVRRKADAAAEEARAVAPVDTGAYRDSIRVERSGQGYAVVAGDAEVDYAVFLEFGTGDTPTFAPLRRGLETLGR